MVRDEVVSKGFVTTFASCCNMSLFWHSEAKSNELLGIGYFIILLWPIAELLGDLLDKKPKESGGIDSIIVVDGIPKVGPERLEKLQSVIRKIFSSFGKLVSEHYPTSEDGSTKG